MAITLARQTLEHADAVRAFNARLVARDAVPGFLLQETPPPARAPEAPIVKRTFLALEDSAVRGGFELHSQRFWVAGELRQASHYRAPISEGIADRRYAFLGMLMVREALRAEPFLFCVGMGGVERALPRLLGGLKFALGTVPFLFRMRHPARVLRELPAFRMPPGRARLARLLARSGVGWGALRLHARAADLLMLLRPRLLVEPVAAWDRWADELWTSERDGCALVAVRDAAALAAMYPLANPRNICVRFSHQDRVVGWAVLFDTQMQGHEHFGNLRVGTVLDCWARAGYAESVAHAATRVLEARGVDLLLTNQTHATWIRAFRRVGYLQGPSNYGLALSPALAAAVRAVPDGDRRMHVTRGDGDGRIHL